MMNILARKIIFQFFKKTEIERLLFSCTNYTSVARISNFALGKMGENIILHRIQITEWTRRKLNSNSEIFGEVNDVRTHPQELLVCVKMFRKGQNERILEIQSWIYQQLGKVWVRSKVR